jgi:metal-responsive CopG/Arc/MetJ family transcriptional regulator
MSGKNKVEMQIPREELENIDALVREGYYGSRNDAIKDILKRGAVYTRLRLRYKFLPFFYFFSLSR